MRPKTTTPTNRSLIPSPAIAQNGAMEELDSKVDFHHPYQPYDVQLQFMRTVYRVLERGDGQVGVLESPTGTGKSLSLICSALTWLRNHKRAKYAASSADAASSLAATMAGEPDWVIEQALRRQREHLARSWEEREARLDKARAREHEVEALAARGRGGKKRRIDAGGVGGKAQKSLHDEEAEFLVGGRDGLHDDNSVADLSAETRDLLRKSALEGEEEDDDEDDEDEEEIKIYYTSRTHSQLTQFISELRRPAFPPSIPPSVLSTTRQRQASSDSDGRPAAAGESVKQVPLSSRQKLCVNPSVSRLSSLSAINDRCAELQQPSAKTSATTSASQRCPFLPSATALVKQTHQFRDAVLATVPDMEDLHRLGIQHGVCPYYASRSAIPGAEVVTLPYPLLLQKEAREALGIKLEGSVVVVDEAHNIMDAVAGVHAAGVRLAELRAARAMLAGYVRRFGKRLKGENRVMVAQVGKVVEALREWLEGALGGKIEQGVVDPNMLLKARGADQINLFHLIKYIQESKLAYKVESYASYVEEKEQQEQQQQEQQQPRPQPGISSKPASSPSASSSTPVLHTLVAFLSALTNLRSEGRIFFEKVPAARPTSQPDIRLSYLLLSPTNAFSPIASAARALILAGGTMSPFDDYRTHLFPHHPAAKITTLSCGHVIPRSNLCVWTLASSTLASSANSGGAGGAGGAGHVVDANAFEFSFQKRSDRGMIRRLGLAILNVCAVVPDGVVVFFPSYGYLDEVVGAWQKGDQAGGSGSVVEGNHRPKTVWERLQARKTVLRESKGGSSDEVLAEYSAAILGNAAAVVDKDRKAGDETMKVTGKATDGEGGGRERGGAASTGSGALLLAIVGGKMSEGINFSDRLGRCVVIVGLPYPNVQSPEWKARMEYVEGATLERLMKQEADGSGGSSGGRREESQPSAGSSGNDGTSTRGGTTAVPMRPLLPYSPNGPAPATSPTEEQATEHDCNSSAAAESESRKSTAPKITDHSPSSPTPSPQARAAAKQAARDFYENACMRAVNQSIGRAIRHRGDYAAIVLCDKRFATERIREKLPGWIREGMMREVEGREGGDGGGAERRDLPGLMGALSGFFRTKRAGG